MFRWLMLASVLAAVIAGLVVGVLNPQSVALDLVVVSVELPLGALVLMALALGILTGLVMAFVLFVLPRRLASLGRSGDSPAKQRLTDQSNA